MGIPAKGYGLSGCDGFPSHQDIGVTSLGQFGAGGGHISRDFCFSNGGILGSQAGQLLVKVSQYLLYYVF